jgi:ribosomal RNA-processing protein 12
MSPTEQPQDYFLRVRNSNAEHDKKIKVILFAVEHVMEEKSGVQPSTVAYFASLMSLLDQTDESESETITGIVYLLSIIFPYLNPNFLCSKYEPVSLLLVPIMKKFHDNSLLVRSITLCFEHLLSALMICGITWNSAALDIYFMILTLSSDESPKVRKRAQEAVQNLLGAFMKSKKEDKTVLDVLVKFLGHAASNSSKSNSHTNQLNCVLGLLKVIIPELMACMSEEDLERLMLQYVSMNQMRQGKNSISITCVISFHQFLQQYFKALKTVDSSVLFDVGYRSLLDLKPEKNRSGTPVMNSFLDALEKLIMLVESKQQDPMFVKAIGEILPLLTSYFETEGEKSKLLGVLNLFYKSCFSILDQNASISTLEGLFHWKYQSSIKEVLMFIRDVIPSYESAPVDFSGLISCLGQLKEDQQFRNIPDLDACFRAVISVAGIEATLKVLPLNLNPDVPNTKDTPPRAWMLVLLKDSVQKSSLKYFRENIYEIIEKVRPKITALKDAGKDMDAKVYETLYVQLWGLLPGFFKYPVDFVEEFKYIAKDLGQVLNSEPLIRAVVCKAFDNLLRVKHDGPPEYNFESEYAAELQLYSKNFVPLLLNVYTATSDQLVLNLIGLYIQVTEMPLVHHYFKTVLKNMGKAAIDDEKKVYGDILISMIPALDETGLEFMWQLLKSEESTKLFTNSYKILSSLLSHTKGKLFYDAKFEELWSFLLDDTLEASEKKFRIKVIECMISYLPDSGLAKVPLILPEVMFYLKDVNEKTRTMAYELVISMAYRMKKGGKYVVDEEEREASLYEYFQMVVAGLAGESPAMISATILALSRIIFEFREEIKELESGMEDDASEDNLYQFSISLMDNIVLLLTCKTKEIVKACLSFIKVYVLTFSNSTIEKSMKEMLANLFEWSIKDSKLKSTVKHLIERLLRKFEYEHLLTFIPEEHHKLMISIKKRKEKAKKGTSLKTTKTKHDQFLQALDSEDEGEFLPQSLQSLSVEEEKENEVEDFTKANVPMFKKKGGMKKKTEMKSTGLDFNEEGMLIVKDETKVVKREEKSIDYYKLSKENPDGYERMPSGKLKFNKRKADFDEEEYMEEGEKEETLKKNVVKQKVRMSDARRKTDQYEPYAYIPLSQKVAGKRQGSKMQQNLKNVLQKKARKQNK